MTTEKTPSETPPRNVAAPDRDKTLNTQALFGDQKEIFIDHDGERYRLRITRRNKLILQK